MSATKKPCTIKYILCTFALITYIEQNMIGHMLSVPFTH